MKRRSMAWLLAALLVVMPACGDVTEGIGGEGGEGGGEQQENEGGGGDGGGEQENEGGGEEGGD
jgi:hypothetical protein